MPPQIITPISDLVSILAMSIGLIVMTMVFAVLIGQVISNLFEGA